MATSCLDEHRFGVVSGSKDEVKFSAELKKGVQTRTLYGEDNQATNIKVKWVDGDKVMVFGTTCVPPASENQMGEYTIKIAGENAPNNDNDDNKNMSIADDLVKIEEVGVRWGSAETSDFVAVYPSDNAAFQFNSSTGVVTASTSISATQNYVFSDEMVQKTLANGTKINVWEGTHFANDATNPSMQNAIMYARTDDVKNGNPVSLSFEPFSTVLKFRFEGFESLWSTDAEAYIQSITLKAPTGVNIAGDFDISIPRVEAQSTTPVTAVATGNNSNTITINTIKQGGAYLKIAANQAVEFNVFTLPLDGLTITGDENTSVENLWTVTIQVQGVGDLTYKLLPVDGTDGNAKTYTLVPGYIHKVKVPKMISNKVPEWNPENWITQIPPPVYISELSVPGAWYAGDLANYQESATLTQLYSKGVRAFHVDCRMSPGKWEEGSGWLSGLTPTGDNILVCAGTDKVSAVLGYVTSATVGTTVLSALQEISSQIRDDEYVVVVLSICEKPLDTSVGDWHETFGSINPADVIPAIKSLINTYGESLKVFGYYDHPTNTTIKTKGKIITKDTTVEDVLGSMIIKINTNTDAISSYEYPTSSLVSFASMASDPDYNVSGDVITDLAYDYFAKMQESNLYWSNSTSSSLKYYYHQAQKTRITENATATTSNPIPTIKDRKAAIDAIISNSKEIYDNAQHDVWFQMGIGGYNESNASDKTSVSSSLNSYLKTKIDAKMDTDPSPVGIVLMNNCLSSTDLIQSIIEMNGKFYLNRRGNDIVTGDGEQNGANQSAVTKSCGNATIGFDAF